VGLKIKNDVTEGGEGEGEGRGEEESEDVEEEVYHELKTNFFRPLHSTY
jgi:hypothetical protein